MHQFYLFFLQISSLISSLTITKYTSTVNHSLTLVCFFFFLSQMDLAGLFLKIGVKNQRITLLLTDAQIPDEQILVWINLLLASGEFSNPQ